MHTSVLTAPPAPSRERYDRPAAIPQLVTSGSWLRISRVFDEMWLPPEAAPNPENVVRHLRAERLRSDIFTFAQPVPETERRYRYYFEWENSAVALTHDFDAWWNALPQESRKNVRKAQKRGIAIAPAAFDDDLVRGIKALYDETPIRQGRRFIHYGKDLETVRMENASYLDRSQFIAARLDGTLVGFIKFVRVGSTARIMQILAMNAHYDKHPTNALLASAIEHCSRHGISHLIYGQYVYGNKHGSSVTEFKRRNGFTAFLTPRYYIPLTAKGQLALAMRLHRRMTEVLPEPLINFLLNARSATYGRILRARGRERTPTIAT